ncbi:hypothetical protein ACFL3G_13705, partial [Planctomycetota bacterium]
SYHYVVRGSFFYKEATKSKIDSEVCENGKEKKSSSVPVEDGLFFPEDFRKLHKRHAIYIKKGLIIDLDKL